MFRKEYFWTKQSLTQGRCEQPNIYLVHVWNRKKQYLTAEARLSRAESELKFSKLKKGDL